MRKSTAEHGRGLVCVAQICSAQAEKEVLAPAVIKRLALAESDSTLGQIVRRQFHTHPITGDDADKVLAHFSGHMGNYAMPALQLDTESGIGKGLRYRAFNFNRFFLFCHT